MATLPLPSRTCTPETGQATRGISKYDNAKDDYHGKKVITAMFDRAHTLGNLTRPTSTTGLSADGTVNNNDDDDGTVNVKKIT